MKIRTIILLILLTAAALPSGAVLKEKDLTQTLSILRHELEKAHNDLGEEQKRLTEISNKMRKQIVETMSRANQNALMLYSQKQDFVFDLTYACHEATDQYNKFHQDVLPFRQWVNKSNVEVARYDSLIQSLSTMPVMMLDDRAKIDRNVCLTLAVNIRRMVLENSQTLQEYMRYYQMSETHLKNLNDYAQKRYSDIQNNIFRNGDENYLTIISNLSSHINSTKLTVEDKYTTDKKVRSQWDAGVIGFLFGAIIIYGIIAVILNQIVMRLIVTRLMHRGMFNDNIKKKFFAKRACIIMTTTVVTFAVILNIVSAVMEQNFILMASNLLTQFAWLMSVILISILIRVESERTMKTFFIYLPLLFMGFIVIACRIVLIPNDLVNLFLPPLLLVCMVWQGYTLRKYRKLVQKSDSYFALISQMVFIMSVVCSWIGYTLLSVQILIWWIMQLTCILSITCLRDWYSEFAKRKNIDTMPITKTWFYYFFTKVITPTAAVASFLLSIYWAAEVFNLTDMTRKIFLEKFINSENFVVSLNSISIVIILWFVFSYLNFLMKSLVRYHYDKIDRQNAESRSVMFVNVIQVFILGAWFLISLSIFHVSNEWLVVISGGFSTGIGFASKDIIENIYYGISLMAGRIRIGDLIVCDGTRGKVKSISYTSTMIEAVDGSVIAFTNSQLFTKNYKNLTHNHGFEVSVVEAGVAYGTSIDFARKLIVDAVSALPCVDKTDGHTVSVLLKELSDSCVTLKIVSWVNAQTAAADNCTILECVYNTLNKHNIEIPFPQRDIHIIPAE